MLSILQFPPLSIWGNLYNWILHGFQFCTRDDLGDAFVNAQCHASLFVCLVLFITNLLSPQLARAYQLSLHFVLNSIVWCKIQVLDFSLWITYPFSVSQN